MLKKMFLAVAAPVAVMALMMAMEGCGGGGGGSIGPSPASSGSASKGFRAALAACNRLGIEIRSTRPGSLINGVIPENTDKGRPLVNMSFSGGRVKIEFYNAPAIAGWEARWRKTIVNAIQSTGSAGVK